MAKVFTKYSVGASEKFGFSLKLHEKLWGFDVLVWEIQKIGTNRHGAGTNP